MDHLEESNLAVADFLDNAGDDDLEMDENGGLTSKHMKKLDELCKKFEAYCKELAVYGFNSARYDIKLIRKYLFKELCEHDQQPNFTVRKAGKYPCIKTEHLKFMDILQFLAPGYNLRSFPKLLVLPNKKVSFLMIISLLQNNSMKPHYSTKPSWKKNLLCFKNWSIKEHLNKKPCKPSDYQQAKNWL